jgi:hypothetical protein
MTLITSAIPNLINGVSQQPATLRLASQAEEQSNFLSSVTDGLKRRPGSRFLAKVSNSSWDDAFLHTINRDRTERYLVAIRDGLLTVYDAKTGVQRTVNAPGGFSYLTGGAKNSFRAVTVADYTFIVNRDKIAQMDAATTPARQNRAIINVRAGNYGKKYRVFINGILRGGFDTPDGSQPAHIDSVRTGFIADRLHGTLSGTIAMPAGTTQGAGSFTSFTYQLLADTVIITSSSPTPFTVTVQDDTGGTAIVAVVSKTQRFTDLPRNAPNGFSVEIVGDNTSNFDNYHVTFESEGSAGVWQESAKGGEQFRFNPTTMPHILVRETNGTFTFRAAEWADRKVGDQERIPNASFIGRKISDVFFFRNRLGLLADENVILSKQGEFFDFWRDTATTVLDTDPLDLAVSNTKVSILNHALPFNQSLLLFSDGAQFMLQAGDILSAETAYVAQATEFESTAGVRPVGVGQYVYFPVPRGSFTGLREYYVEEGNEQNDALDVTSHCPRYVPKDIFRLSASTSEDLVVAISAAAPNTLWVYKFYYGEGGKLQSAWSRWDFSTEDRLLSAEFIESELYLTVARDDGTYIERLDIESGALDDEATIYYHVDRGTFLTGGTFNASANTTTFTLPFATNEDLWVFVGGGDGVFPETHVPPILARPSPTTVLLAGNWVGRKLFAGVRFRSHYKFSTLFLRTQETGGGVLAMDDGRLQVRRMSVNFARAGYFKTTVTPEGRTPSVREFTGRRLAASSATLGQVELSDGRFSFPVMGRNKGVSIEIESDHFLPCAFTSAEWEATYHTRARRV